MVRFKKETLGEDPEGHRNGVGTGSLDFGIGGAMEGRDECQVDRKHYYHRGQHSESLGRELVWGREHRR